MLTIFKKEKKADVRILHICGIKIKYKKKYKIKSINKQHVQNEINRSKINGISSSKRKPELIVSLTSFPQRIYDLHFCIYSLLKQSLKPDKIILWLGQDEFPNKEKDLTEDLIKFTRMGLTIRFCKDIGSYTKLIYALREFPDDIIITADDDIYYEKNWLEKLYNAYKKQPDMIHCHRANGITTCENEVLSDKRWINPKKMNSRGASYSHFMTGVGGVLYPPHCLYKDVFDSDKYTKMAPKHDDAWFWAMAVLNDTKINIINKNINRLTYINRERELNLNNETTLWKTNKNEGYSQVEKILKYYPQIRNKLIDENRYKKKN